LSEGGRRTPRVAVRRRESRGPLNLALGAIIVLAVAGVSIAAMLLVRRRAPEGSFLAD
jgi:hypothetical protein